MVKMLNINIHESRNELIFAFRKTSEPVYRVSHYSYGGRYVFQKNTAPYVYSLSLAQIFAKTPIVTTPTKTACDNRLSCACTINY